MKKNTEKINNLKVVCYWGFRDLPTHPLVCYQHTKKILIILDDPLESLHINQAYASCDTIHNIFCYISCVRGVHNIEYYVYRMPYQGWVQIRLCKSNPSPNPRKFFNANQIQDQVRAKCIYSNQIQAQITDNFIYSNQIQVQA